MDKCPSLGIGRHVTGCCILEAFDDGLIINSCRFVAGYRMNREKPAHCFSTPIVSNDDSEGRVEFNDLDMLVVEGAYASDGELIEGSPKQSAEDYSHSISAYSLHLAPVVLTANSGP